jgi:hypothetical protein
LKPICKYWPSLAEIVRVIGQDADFAATKATDPLTRAATTGSRGSKADFFKALFGSMEENNVRNHGHLPRGFKLSDETLASLANCALDLGPDGLLDGPTSNVCGSGSATLARRRTDGSGSSNLAQRRYKTARYSVLGSAAFGIRETS